MGVNLSDLVKGEQIELSDLSGKMVAIDAYNSLYQFLSIIRDRFTGEPLRDSKGRITSHLSGLFYRTSKLMENGIIPVYIFDGEPPAFKKHTVEERAKRREEAGKRWKKALEEGRIEDARAAAQQSSRLTDEMVEDSKQLLKAMGVSWVQAPSEGEAQAAYMTRKGIVYASASQDWDSILFGAPVMIRNLTITGRRKLPRKEKYIEIRPEIIRLEQVLKGLGITHDQLIILGILVGTDYNPGGVKGIGAKTALKLVKEHKTLGEVMKNVEWKFLVAPEDIFDFFRNPPAEEIEIEKNNLDPDMLVKIMVEEHSFSAERTNSVIEKLKELGSKGRQTALNSFMG
jgi:flap endonuclease-1